MPRKDVPPPPIGACDRLTTWLAQPTDPHDHAIRDELHRTLLGRTSMILFGGACSVSMALVYALLQNRVVGALLFTACGLSVLQRLRASRPAAALCPTQQACAIISSSLIWTSIVGATGAVCVASAQMSLVMLASCVVTGLAFGAMFNNAAAPRFARVQVSVILLPMLLSAACVHAPHMRWILLQTPLWIGGMFFVVDKAYAAVSSLIHAQRRATYLALNDQLTGLANRAGILAQLTRCCDDPHPLAGTESYVLFLDLDGFKDVNDAFGHAAGDELLCSVARRLSACLRPTDVLGRFGGDEFIALLTNVTAEQVQQAAERIVLCLAQTFDLDTAADVRIGVSIGGVPLSAARSATGVLEKADALLYAAKRAGKGTVRLSVPATKTPSAERHNPFLHAQVLCGAV